MFIFLSLFGAGEDGIFRTSSTLYVTLYLPRGPFFGSEGKFEIKTSFKIVVKFLAHEPVNFTSLTDNFIVLFSKLLKL